MSTAAPQIKQCSVCGTQFECGAQRERCWCQNLPPLRTDQLAINVDCRCPACLAELLRAAACLQPLQNGT